MGLLDRFLGTKKTDDKQKLLDGVTDQQIKARTGAVDADAIPKGYGPFGLCSTNPVPIEGLTGSRTYLGLLRSRDGIPVTTNRIGSTEAPEVTSGVIDIYQVAAGGIALANVYLCPYHKRNSKRAPDGMRLAMPVASPAAASGRFAELQQRLKDNPGPSVPRKAPPPTVLSSIVLQSATALAAATHLHMRSGHSATDAIRAIEVAQNEMLGSAAVVRKATAGDDYPAGEYVIRTLLTGDVEKDASVIKNYLLRVVLFVFEEETGGPFRCRAHHAKEIVEAIAREFDR